jgi:hypothetical protein
MSTSRSRWLTWAPNGSIIDKSPEPELPKPPKPSSGSFGGASPRDFQNIDQPPALTTKATASIPELVGQAQTRDELGYDYERRFGTHLARLFPFIGRRVSTPAGTGTLMQVLATRVTVDFGERDERGRQTARFFKPSEVCPIQ